MGDEYLVRLTRPELARHGDEPRPVPASSERRRRRFPRGLAVLGVLAVLVAVNPSGAKGLLDRALDLVRSPVDALESDYQLRKAEEALDRQWRRQRTYLLTPAQLAELEPDVEWGEKVEVDVCRDGRAVALVARTVDGVVTLLMIQGRNHGDAQGEHACPAGDSGLAPWTE